MEPRRVVAQCVQYIEALSQSLSEVQEREQTHVGQRGRSERAHEGRSQHPKKPRFPGCTGHETVQGLSRALRIPKAQQTQALTQRFGRQTPGTRGGQRLDHGTIEQLLEAASDVDQDLAMSELEPFIS